MALALAALGAIGVGVAICVVVYALCVVSGRISRSLGE